MKKNEKRIRFRKNGFVIEFEKNNGYLWFYIFRKTGAFIVDMMIYIIMLIIFIYVIESSLLKSFIISYFLFLVYFVGIIMLFENKTIGMILTSLVFGTYDGDLVTRTKLINRSFMMSIYAVPILGIILMITSFLSMIINKGLTPLDLFSKTQTFNKRYHSSILKIYEDIDWKNSGKE